MNIVGPAHQILRVSVFACLLMVADHSNAMESGASPARLREVIVDGISATPEQFQDILIVRNGETIVAERNMYLHAGTMISTGNATAILTFEDDNVEVQLFTNSQLDVLNPSVRAVVGGLFVKIRKRLKEVFKVKSEYGVAGAEGTQFAVFAGPESNSIEVYDGSVTIEPEIQGGAPLVIEVGYGVLLEPDEAPQIYPLPEAQMQEILGRVRFVDAAAVLEYEPIPVAALPSEVKVPDPELVRQAQQWLHDLEYDPGPVTGELSDQTVAEIGRFKADTGQPGDLEVNQALIDSLKAEWKRRNMTIIDALPPEPETLGLPTPPEGKTYPPDHLTPEDIRRCAIDKIKFDRRKQALDEELKQLNSLSKVLDDEASEIDRQRSALDGQDQATVDAFNAGVDAYNVRRRQHNDGPVREYNRHGEDLQAVQREINNLCTEKWMYREDIEKVKEDLGLERFPFTLISRP